MKTHFWIYLLLICAGIVVGTLAGSAAAQISWLSWLNFGIDFGLTTPFVLDLQAVSLTFGFTLKLTVSVIIFVVLAILLGRLIVKR